jgi:membrane-associated protease RseP (regulator of RpoE activity)
MRHRVATYLPLDEWGGVAIAVTSLDNAGVSRLSHTLALFLVVVFLGSLGQAQNKKAVEFRDPLNRFSLVAPAGWMVRPLGNSVQIAREDAYVSVMVFDHANDARETVDTLGQNIGKKWKNFQSMGNSSDTLSGRPAEIATFSGTNSQGTEAVLQLQCVLAGGTAYVLVVSAPKPQFPQRALADIVRSFTLLGGTPATRVEKPTLGADLTDLSPEDAASYGLSEPAGALVVNLAENGPAQTAGLKLHDLILKADGQAIDSAASLEQVITAHKAGDEFLLEFLRIGDDDKPAKDTVKVKVGKSSP